MIFKPAILALLMGASIVSFLLLYSCCHAFQIVRNWDLKSGSELQLSLENRTYLISTLVAYAFSFQLLTLFLFIYTADHIHTFVIGAMCAAGTLNTNGWGYPVVILKVFNFLLAGLWLILNFADNQSYDYPLIKKKYLLLIGVSPLILAEAVMQTGFFLDLNPNIITSCCGTMFSGDEAGITGHISIPAPKWVVAGYYGVLATTIALGAIFIQKARWGYLFSVASLCTFLLSVAAVISFISPYFYELPTHHCPFCILQAEYRYIGYLIYLSLLGGTLFGMGVALLMPFRRMESLKDILPALQRKLAFLSIGCFLVFTLVIAYGMLFSNLRV